jgi:peptidoglycan/LPS O-acetylase OafA/YrhL
MIVGLLGYGGVLTVHRWEWLSSLLFFRNYIAARDCGWYLAHFWSLAVEEHFYLIWPGLLVLFGSRRARWAVVILALSVAAWRVLDFREQWIFQLAGADFYTRTDIRLDALLWGCWMALLLDSPNWRAWLASRMTLGTWTMLVGALMCCVVYRPPLAMLWEAMLVPLVLAGTVLRPTGLVGRFLESQPMRWIGRISYGLYIWQQLFLVGSQEPHPLPMGILQTFPINLVCVFAVAAASYYVIERPFIEMGQSLSRRITPEETGAGVEIDAAPRPPDGSVTERYACSG